MSLKTFLTSVLYILVCLVTINANQAKSKNNKDGDFNTVYDDVYDSTTVTHKDLKPMGLFSIGNLSGGHNIRLYISNNALIMYVDYNSSWLLYIQSLVFLNDKGERFEITDGRHSVNVVSSGYNEYYIKALTGDTLKKFEDILHSSKITVSFLGKHGRTDKLKIKPKIKNAMIATIDKWRELQGDKY